MKLLLDFYNNLCRKFLYNIRRTICQNESLLELKRNSIKDTPKSEPTSDNIVELMEKEWRDD